jgi:hypothetical protein
MCTMRKNLPLVLVTAMSLTSLAAVGAARPHSSIQGVWRTAEVTAARSGAVVGRQPPSLGIITAKYYSRVEIHGAEPRPALADAASATADQLRATWGPFFAEAGTYELSDGNVLTTRPLVAKNPAVMSSGFFVAYTYRIEGDTLWLTEQRNQRGPIADPHIIKLARVE